MVPGLGRGATDFGPSAVLGVMRFLVIVFFIVAPSACAKGQRQDRIAHFLSTDVRQRTGRTCPQRLEIQTQAWLPTWYDSNEEEAYACGGGLFRLTGGDDFWDGLPWSRKCIAPFDRDITGRCGCKDGHMKAFLLVCQSGSDSFMMKNPAPVFRYSSNWSETIFKSAADHSAKVTLAYNYTFQWVVADEECCHLVDMDHTERPRVWFCGKLGSITADRLTSEWAQQRRENETVVTEATCIRFGAQDKMFEYADRTFWTRNQSSGDWSESHELPFDAYEDFEARKRREDWFYNDYPWDAKRPWQAGQAGLKVWCSGQLPDIYTHTNPRLMPRRLIQLMVCQLQGGSAEAGMGIFKIWKQEVERD